MTEADRLSDERHGICKCTGCAYYQTTGNRTNKYAMCIFTANGGYRPMRPIDCYKHEGTPYKPRVKKKGGN